MADRGSSHNSSTSSTSTAKGGDGRLNQIYNNSVIKQPPLGKTSSSGMNSSNLKGGKHMKGVHRTTSESLRLDASGNHLHHHHDRLSIGSSGSSSGTGIGPNSTISSMMAAGASSSSLNSSSSGGSGPILRSASQSSGSGGSKPKTSSFQITSVVTIGGAGGHGPRISSNSNDNGDDSADDLDESHAEDKSVITDETPSFSEDTFSKEDVFFTSSDAIGSAPVIPTSSQYGLAIVAPNLSGTGGQNMADVHVSVSDAGINLMTNSKKDGDLKEIHHRNERFKVVKIESTEPFRRGRWICMDYLDHSTLQPTLEEQQQQQRDVDGSPDTTVGKSIHNEDPLSQDNDSQAMTQSVVEITGDLDSGMTCDSEMGAVGGTVTTKSDESPGQSLQQPLNVSTTPGKSTTNTESPLNTTTTSQASGNSSPQTNTVILASNTNNTTNFQQGQSQPAQYYSQQVSDQNVTSQQQQQQQQPMLHHGATMPANLLQTTASTNTSQNTQNNQQQSPVLPQQQQQQQLSVSVDTAFHPQQDSPQYNVTSPQQQQQQHMQQTDPSSSSSSTITLNSMQNGPISVLDPPSTLPLNNSNTNLISNTSNNNSQNVTQLSNETSTAGSVPASTEAVINIESNNPNDLLNSANKNASAPASNSTLISPSQTAPLQPGQSLPQQLINNIVAEDGSAEDSERNAQTPNSSLTEPTPNNMVMRGGRLRYLTVPLIDPLPEFLNMGSNENSNANSSSNLAGAGTGPAKSSSHTDLYTNIALGNSNENLTSNLTKQSNTDLNNSSNPIATPLCPLNMACHHKSIQKLIKEETVSSPISIPQRGGGSADNLNQISGSISGRSSPARQSFSTPNSPPKYISSGSCLTGTTGDTHRFTRAPSPLLHVSQTCSTGDHRYVNIQT